MGRGDLAEGEGDEPSARCLAASGELDEQLQQKHLALQAHAENTKSQQTTMMLSLVIGLTLLVVLIGLLGIYFTHKVAGPIYKMKLLLGQVADGKLNFQGRLRKGDELQEFFEVFAGMVEKLKARQAAEVADLDAAIEEAKVSGASDAALSKLTKVRDVMRAALEK